MGLWGGLKMEGGSQNGGWGHLDPIGDPKSYGDFSTVVRAGSWGGSHGGWGGGVPKWRGGVSKWGLEGLKIGVGGTSTPLEAQKSYGDFSTMVSARS